MVKRFQRSGRPGFYLRVAVEGELEAGSSIALIAQAPERIAVADVFRAYFGATDDARLLGTLAELPALPEGWRERFRSRLGGA